MYDLHHQDAQAIHLNNSNNFKKYLSDLCEPFRKQQLIFTGLHIMHFWGGSNDHTGRASFSKYTAVYDSGASSSEHKLYQVVQRQDTEDDTVSSRSLPTHFFLPSPDKSLSENETD